ncbi:MAG: hypothetical protein ACRDO2_11755 [Nocardioidaceae bacterium]
MSTIDIIDEVFVVADPAAVRAATCDVDRWRGWFPELALTPYKDRGALGVRWRLSGAVTGTAEVWLQEFGDGVIVHTYVRAQPSPAANRRVRDGRRLGREIKRHMTAVKDELETGRKPGVPRVALGRRAAQRGRLRPGRPRLRRRRWPPAAVTRP